MSTRSRIGIQTPQGIKHIYCHWDGYPSYVGKILLEHYNSPALAAALIEQGNMSALRPLIGEKHDFNKPNHDWCIFYARDRGDEGQEASTHKTERGFLNATERSWGEYAYLYKGNQWHCRRIPESLKTLSKVEFYPLKDFVAIPEKSEEGVY